MKTDHNGIPWAYDLIQEAKTKDKAKIDPKERATAGYDVSFRSGGDWVVYFSVHEAGVHVRAIQNDMGSDGMYEEELCRDMATDDARALWKSLAKMAGFRVIREWNNAPRF